MDSNEVIKESPNFEKDIVDKIEWIHKWRNVSSLTMLHFSIMNFKMSNTVDSTLKIHICSLTEEVVVPWNIQIFIFEYMVLDVLKFIMYFHDKLILNFYNERLFALDSTIIPHKNIGLRNLLWQWRSFALSIQIYYSSTLV